MVNYSLINRVNDLDFHYPPELPVSAYRADVLSALKGNPVVIVCGDTGSGKTTQLPKMALELRLASSVSRPLNHRRIACTQPRRLAAVTMAERVAAELGSEVGSLVGYRHRFGRKVSSLTRIEFMTDGVLLAETRFDPLLRAYDTIIVDEAHERSLNVDFLLGILKRILERRRDLKVIVSSATLDVDRFAAFFGQAPVISVPGRLFPITTLYRPPPEDEERDLPRDIAAAVLELPPGDDILVFLPGERDIRETADHLAKSRGGFDDVIPLLASLPAAEQRRAFQPSSRRRSILAPNVAETSVTIPGIRAVIDTGLARISRYVHRTQVQRLQIEPVSQASARQRMGRCGRLGPGTCIRLYSEEDFNSRDAYTPPEVLRSSLAGVILTMLDLKLGDIERFPFIDPPKPAMVHEGLRELVELGAVRHGGRETEDGRREIELTDIGKKLAKIPVEPRLARMLLAASENAVLPSVLPLVAAMACDDPRRRPIEEKQLADQAHAKFRVPGSDFLGTLRLWHWWEDETADLSQSKARKICKANYLSYPKMREWRDLTRQLESLAKRLGLSFAETLPLHHTPSTHSPKPETRNQTPETRNQKPETRNLETQKPRNLETQKPRNLETQKPRNQSPDPDFSAALHRSLLAGLLGRIGKFDSEERDYRGARGLRFAIHPSSILAKKDRRRETKDGRQGRETKDKRQEPQWIVAGELVDTARLFARNAAVIDPRWLEPVAGPVCKHSYHSPEWDPSSGFVRATEQVTLYGLVIVPARRCDFSRIDLAFSREIFIRAGLVGGEFPRPSPPIRENLAFLDALRKRAERMRHPEFFDAAKFESFFAEVIPPEVASADALRKWLRAATPAELDRFRLKKADWWPNEAVEDREFPETIRIAGAKLFLSYRHAPDDPDEDGITCTVRKSDAAALRLWRSEWLVPGYLPEKLTWMLSVLPTALRRALAPLDESVTILLSLLKPGSEPLEDALRRTVLQRWGFRIPEDAWSRAKLPLHLQMRFRIRDDATGRPLAVSRNLDDVLRLVPSAPSRTGVDMTAGRAGSPAKFQTWAFGTLAEKASDRNAGWDTVNYQALHDDGDGVTLRLYPDAEAAALAHAAGVTRLFVLALEKSATIPFRRKRIAFDAALYLKDVDYADERIAADILAGAVAETLVRGRPPVRTQEEFERRLAESRSSLVKVQSEMTSILVESAAAATSLNGLMADERVPEETADSVASQLAWLLYRGFPRNVPLAQLRHYRRYLKGAAVRLERARLNARGDLEKEAYFEPYWEQYREAAKDRSGKFHPLALADYRWMLEEYRVSLFAQELHTPEPVSPKRLAAKWAEVTE